MVLVESIALERRQINFRLLGPLSNPSRRSVGAKSGGL